MSAAGENPIQELIRQQLQRNAYFTVPTSVGMVTIDDGDIDDVIAQKVTVLGGGLAISVECPVGDNLDPESGAVNIKTMVEIAALEHARINRSVTGLNKSAYAAIRKLMAPYRPGNQGGLHYWNPGPPFARLELQGYTAGKGVIKGSPLIIYRAIFEVKEVIV